MGLNENISVPSSPENQTSSPIEKEYKGIPDDIKGKLEGEGKENITRKEQQDFEESLEDAYTIDSKKGVDKKRIKEKLGNIYYKIGQVYKFGIKNSNQIQEIRKLFSEIKENIDSKQKEEIKAELIKFENVINNTPPTPSAPTAPTAPTTAPTAAPIAPIRPSDSIDE